MDKSLQQNLNQTLEFLQKGMTTVYDFSKQEVPLFIKEYLQWYFYEHLINAIVLGIFSAISLAIVYYCYKDAKKNEAHDGHFAGIGLGTVAFLCTVSINVNCNIEELVKVQVAPRVVLMEQAKVLFK
jgi:hypothetical protein